MYFDDILLGRRYYLVLPQRAPDRLEGGNHGARCQIGSHHDTVLGIEGGCLPDVRNIVFHSDQPWSAAVVNNGGAFHSSMVAQLLL
jgi:hypothetical protein